MSAQARPDPRIRWPAGLAPESCPVFAHNEIEAAVAAQDVWSWLIAARRWHTFYGNCKRLRIRDRGGDHLGAGTRFTWWTFGVPVNTTVNVFEEGRYLAWSGRGLGSRGHHV